MTPEHRAWKSIGDGDTLLIVGPSGCVSYVDGPGLLQERDALLAALAAREAEPVALRGCPHDGNCSCGIWSVHDAAMALYDTNAKLKTREAEMAGLRASADALIAMAEGREKFNRYQFRRHALILARGIAAATPQPAPDTEACRDCQGTGHSGNLADELCPTCAGGGKA